MTRVHPTALVAPGACLGEGVVVGPYAVIEEGVEVGPGTVIGPHVVIHSGVRLGARNRIHAHAVIGDLPQDLTYDGAPTRVEIGDENVIREGVTIHRATRPDRPTRVGSRCFLMAYSHVGHDCQVGDDVILTNGVLLGGHVVIEDRAVLGGGVGVHQFARVGRLAMVGGLVKVTQDVLPFTLVEGKPARHYRLNTVGLRRAGVNGERYRALEQAFRALRAGKGLDGVPLTPEVAHLKAFLEAPTKRGITGFVR